MNSDIRPKRSGKKKKRRVMIWDNKIKPRIKPIHHRSTRPSGVTLASGNEKLKKNISLYKRILSDTP
jgi:hypothetical protein